MLEGYLSGSLTEEELNEFLALLPQHEDELSAQLLADLQTGRFSREIDSDRQLSIYNAILQKTKRKKSPVFFLKAPWMVAAASILLVLVTGYLFWFSGSSTSQAREVPVPAHTVQKIVPGHEGAILMLSNGKTVVLDSSANGTLALEGREVVKKNGELLYQPAAENATPVYHTMITPRGRQYALVLPDGSRIWLNAESSIRFPTAFTGKERRVEVSGEVYCEIKPFLSVKGERVPFLVTASGMEVEVLGTRFNINSYGDEGSVNTTLLEGKVRLVSGQQAKGSAATGPSILILKPGQQGRLTNGKWEVVEGLDPEQVVAWKNGLFHFDNEALPAIMKQLQRWYDFELDYTSAPVNSHYSGLMKRQQEVSQVLSKLEMAGGVKFRIEGKKVSVLNDKN